MHQKKVNNKKPLKALAFYALLLVLSTSFTAAETRPKIGLALGGGGAKGGAHIGVLKVLEQANIPVDYIAGTSIGSLIGGLYAMGMSANDIEQIMLAIDWEEGYSDTIAREHLPYRLKQRDQFNIPLNIGHNDYVLKTPSGLLYGQNAALLLRKAFGNIANIDHFDSLPIPFRAIATDLSTNAQVDLDRGNILSAIQASSTVPGILAPVKSQHMLLVDGGIANNIPIDTVKQMGADIVIAIDIGDPLLSADKLSDTPAILGQLSSFLTVASSNQQIRSLTERDVLIRPDISKLSTTDWSTFTVGIQAGQRAAKAKIELLKKASINTQAYAHYRDKKQQDYLALIASNDKEITKIELVNHSKVHPRLISETLNLHTGSAPSPSQITQAIEALYSLDEFQRVSASFIDKNEERTLLLNVEEKSWGPNFLEFGLGWETNFSDQSSTDLDMAHTATNLTQNGGEWRSQIELGNEQKLSTEIYLPLDETRLFYSSAKYTYDATDWSPPSLTALPTSFKEKRQLLKLGIGINYSRHGIFELGALSALGSIDNAYVLTKEVNYDSYGTYMALAWDDLNSASFPTQGNRLKLTLNHLNEDVNNVGLSSGTGSTQYGVRSTQVSLSWKGAISLNSHALVGKADFTKSFTQDQKTSINRTHLGGFLNLSGYNRHALTGQHKAFAALIYQYNLRGGMYRRTQLPLYIGLSAEAGNVWTQNEKIDLDTLSYASSIYLGTNTIMGPIALGYGANDQGKASVYFYLGYAL